MELVKKYSVFFLLVLSCLPASASLFHSGFFVTDDGEWMIIRFSAFHQAFREGEFPVRLLGRLNQEYGYPVSSFLYPGFMYLAEPFHLIGFGFVDSIKLVLGLSLIVSGVFLYLWLKKFFAEFPSLLGALFYVYAPYHLYDIYKRGSVGEMLALAVVPFILWQLERKNLFFSSVGLALLILSHNTLALLFLPLIILYMLIPIWKSKNKKHVLLTILYFMLFGFGLSAFFWVPVVFELSYTVFTQTTVADWRKYFAPLSLVSYASLLVLFITFIFIIFNKTHIKKQRLTFVFFLLGISSLFLALPISSAIWSILPTGFVQFPFRFLSVTILCIAFLVASITSLFKGTKQYIFGVTLLTVLFFSALPFLKPSAYFDKGDGYYMTNMATTTVLDEYMPLWVKEKPTQRFENKVEIIRGKGEVKGMAYTGKEISFNAESEKQAVVRVNTIYWPGWRALVNGKDVSISYNNRKGLIELQVPEGKHNIHLTFGETPLRMMGNVLTLGSFALLIVVSILARKSKMKNQKAKIQSKK